MVWCGMVWYGVVWCGVVWCRVVWYDIFSQVIACVFFNLTPSTLHYHTSTFHQLHHHTATFHQLHRHRYFRWKGSGEMIDTKFWCRLCHMIHHRGDLNTKVWYSNVERWWRGEGVCKSKLDLGTDWVSWRGVDTHRVMKSLKNTFHLIQST